jgi:hypothetical protein
MDPFNEAYNSLSIPTKQVKKNGLKEEVFLMYKMGTTFMRLK